MYQVIARKYRPQSFEDVVNQQHVKQTLINALTQGRVGHGYIFSGPRGTGKTTMARILAKALNCEKGPGATPCQQCSSCREIAGGNSMDLVEIDAASNRRIDDIRELRENVRYRPVRDRYKVFIIDEAHQITADAFNALLKTLEEPPEWVVFILCTTEPQQFPATIVSRCQSFPFRTVEMDDVVGRMQWICAQEGVTADPDALVAIALAGDGSIRDSLSTLDQAIASFGQKLEAGPVRDLLGAIPSEISERILEALRGHDAAAMLGIVDRLAREGRHLQHFCGELTRYFRNLMVMRVSGADTRLVTTGPEERKRLAGWAEQFSQEDLTRYLNLLVDLYRDLQNAPQPRFRLEIGLLKLVYAGRLQPIEKLLAQWPGGGSGPEPGGTEREPKRPGGHSAAGARAGGGAHAVEAGHGAEAGHRVDSGQGVEAAPGNLPPSATATSSAASLAAAAGAGRATGGYTAAPAMGQPAAAPAAEPMAVSRPLSVSESEPAPRQAGPVRSDLAPPQAPATDSQANGGAFAGEGDPAAGLRQRLANALRDQGDDSLADALDHGRVEVRGGILEIRSLPEYRVVLEMGLPAIQDVLAAVLPDKARATLGGDLGPGDSAAPGPDSTTISAPSRATAGAQRAAGAPEAVQRALADPEFQKIQKLFDGQIREVRNLRGYTA